MSQSVLAGGLARVIPVCGLRDKRRACDSTSPLEVVAERLSRDVVGEEFALPSYNKLEATAELLLNL